jgi:hypothetical protein
MPYKYVVSVDSKGFDQAPAEIMYALGRLSWATKQAVGEEAVAPNELLTLGYFDKMSIGVCQSPQILYHLVLTEFSSMMTVNHL